MSTTAASLTYTRPFLYAKQSDALFHGQRYGLTEASTKSGKAQPLNSVIYTPHGPTTMGSLSVGDYVLGLDGEPTKVLEIFPQGPRQIYAITFADGTIVECDGDHLWEVHESRNPPSIVPTKILAEWPEWRRKRAYVPLMEGPAQFAPKEVPLDPYMVGLLIGDGNLTTTVVRFSSVDQEIIDAFWGTIPPGHDIKYLGGCDYHITAGAEANSLRTNNQHITSYLREVGLMGKASHEKSIPHCYLYNDVEIRISILQGIMDTDGTVNSHGQPILEQTSWNLAQDIEILVQSLGGSVLTHEDNSAGYWTDDDRYVQGRTRFRQLLKLRNPDICFRLERKRLKTKPPAKTGGRMFRSILPSRITDAQCIRIDNPRHLYLTNGFIPTHNTVAAIAWIIELAFAGKFGMNYWWVAPVSSQADIAFRRVKQGLPPGSFTARETPTPIITLLTGSVISFKSADNADSLYGEDVYAAVVDEASRCKEESWHAVRSTLTATQGPANIIGNVKGRQNWFYHLARLAEKDGAAVNMHYSKITVLDAIAAGVIAPDEIEDARRTLPENVFRELYMAEPGDDTGNPFGLDHIAACLGELSTRPAIAYGIDLAKKRDWFVVIGLDAEGAVCAFHRWQGIPWRESIRRVHEIVGEDIPALVDSTGIGDPVLEELQVEHGNFRGYIFSAASKQRLMEGLAVSIQGHELRVPDGPIRMELDSFEYELTRTGVKYTAPAGAHDDCVVSLALAREQWSTLAPAKNLMDYYLGEAQSNRAASAALAEREFDETSRRITPFQPLRSDVLDNELTELYLKTLEGYMPESSHCLRCQKPIAGPTRVSDGVNAWHLECAG